MDSEPITPTPPVACGLGLVLYIRFRERIYCIHSGVHTFMVLRRLRYVTADTCEAREKHVTPHPPCDPVVCGLGLVN